MRKLQLSSGCYELYFSFTPSILHLCLVTVYVVEVLVKLYVVEALVGKVMLHILINTTLTQYFFPPCQF
jgi:hypothetical protein